MSLGCRTSQPRCILNHNQDVPSTLGLHVLPKISTYRKAQSCKRAYAPLNWRPNAQQCPFSHCLGVSTDSHKGSGALEPGKQMGVQTRGPQNRELQPDLGHTKTAPSRISFRLIGSNWWFGALWFSGQGSNPQTTTNKPPTRVYLKGEPAESIQKNKERVHSSSSSDLARNYHGMAAARAGSCGAPWPNESHTSRSASIVWICWKSAGPQNWICVVRLVLLFGQGDPQKRKPGCLGFDL